MSDFNDKFDRESELIENGEGTGSLNNNSLEDKQTAQSEGAQGEKAEAYNNDCVDSATDDMPSYEADAVIDVSSDTEDESRSVAEDITRISDGYTPSSAPGNAYGTYGGVNPMNSANPINNANPMNNMNNINNMNNGGNMNGQRPYYTENVRYKKKSHRKGFIAAVLAITVLNLSVMGGMFYMGHKLGVSGRQIASKQELMDSLHGNNSGDNTEGASQTVATGNEMATTEIAKKVGPAVVGIRSTVDGQMTIFGTAQSSQAEGSGIIISKDGYIVTNNHVVDGASKVTVILNTGTENEAKLIGKDAQTDLAVIKIEPKEELTVATLGDSNNIEVGERVVAIGNPMGLEFFGSVTEGIVSAVNRSITVDNRTMNLIQTDAAINSGNSGGALINRFGEVIGINSVKVSTTGVEGMGFAIPSSEAKPVIADLLEHGYVKGRPVIGISTRDVSEYLAKTYSWPQGVQVMEVTSEAAKSAGFQQGDIITEVDGQKVTDTEELNKIKNTHNPGDTLKMTVYKYATGKTETLSVTLSEQIPS